jgi:uncharacterized protein
MLTVELSKISPEGMDIATALAAVDLGLSGAEDWQLDGEGNALKCRIERSEDGSVHIRGSFQARLWLECGRCLERYCLSLDEELDLFYLPHMAGMRANEEEEEVDLSDREMVVAYYDGDRLALGDILREQCVLSVPMKPLCREDCRGLCAVCGISRNRKSCECPSPFENSSPFRMLLDDKIKH